MPYMTQIPTDDRHDTVEYYVHQNSEHEEDVRVFYV
jgi:hypothetical protein